MYDDITIERKKVDRKIHPNFPKFDEEIEMAWGKLGENPFADARYTMLQYFNTDEGLEISYLSNIAMFLNDRCGITDHEERNKLAKELMNLLWG